MAVTAAGHYKVMLFGEFDVERRRPFIMTGVPAFDTIDVFQNVIPYDFSLLVQVWGDINQGGAVGIVGVSQYKKTTGVSDQR